MPRDDYAANITTAGHLSLDGGLARMTGRIDGSWDHDRIRVTLTKGKSYDVRIKASSTGNGTLDDPYLRGVYDRNGHYISGTTNDDGGWDYNARLAFTHESSGDYYIAVDSCGDIDSYWSYVGT